MKLLDRLQNRPRIFNLLHRLGLAAARSQTSAAERACLCRHIAEAGSAVEIGTFMGVTAAELARSLRGDAVLYCVDPYLDGQAIQAIAMRHLGRKGVLGKVRMIQATAEDALGQLPAQVDFIFVDGDHSFEGLCKDWDVVKKLLRPGGIAAFHDVNPQPGLRVNCEGAIRCFDEVIRHDPGFRLVETCESLQVLVRGSHGS